ncbi:MAG: AAA family ATPase [Synergistetes bacterium]|nr:AAA family ATPase [Synergistota bacterium]
MRFWDRKDEIKYLKAYLRGFPNSILFIYGPKSSGKSTLMKRVIKKLSPNQEKLLQKYNILYYDFRSKLIRGARTIIDLFFKVVEEKEASAIKAGIEIDENTKVAIKEGKIEPFELIENRLRESGRKNVIVLDELQKLKGIYLEDSSENGRLLDELFNFFVRITKVEHLAHVIVMTSDTFFVEKLYSNSSLANCAEYYLVDFFSDDIAKGVLVSERLNEVEASYVVSWCGGVPWFLERVLSKKKVLGIREAVKSLYRMVKGEVLEKLGRLWRGRETLAKRDGEVLVKVVMGSGVDMLLKDRESVERLASAEILFYDPLSGTARPQTRLHERAIKEILGL